MTEVALHAGAAIMGQPGARCCAGGTTRLRFCDEPHSSKNGWWVPRSSAGAWLPTLAGRCGGSPGDTSEPGGCRDLPHAISLQNCGRHQGSLLRGQRGVGDPIRLHPAVEHVQRVADQHLRVLQDHRVLRAAFEPALDALAVGDVLQHHLRPAAGVVLQLQAMPDDIAVGMKIFEVHLVRL